jgi:uncharacterized membrane protein
MEVYAIAGLAVLFLLLSTIGPILSDRLRRWKANKAADAASYFTASIFFFSMAIDFALKVHKLQATASLRFVDYPGPEIAMVSLGLIVITAAFNVLQFSKATRRWIILPVIATGIAISFALISQNGPYSGWAFPAYFAPQLLLFFAEKRPRDTIHPQRSPRQVAKPSS